MHGDGLADDEAILDELADGLAGVGVGDFADLVGVEPDLALSAADHGGREALLCAEIDPTRQHLSVFFIKGERVGVGVGSRAKRGSPRLESLPADTARRGGCWPCGMARRRGIEVDAVGISYIFDVVVVRGRGWLS